MARNRLVSLTLFLAAYAPTTLAQTPAPTQSTPVPAVAAAMPKDPNDLMKLATQVNGLDSPDMKPWHLKATYQTFDDQGKPKEQGTFEEWWAGPKKDKRVYTSSTFNQTEYTTDTGTFRVGSQNAPPLAESLVRARLVSPMPTNEDLDGSQLRRRDSPFPKEKLSCVELTRPLKRIELGSVPGVFPFYCFETDRPMLRFSGSYGLLNSSYERIGAFAGHYLGLDIRISDWQKTFLTTHVDGANLLTQVNDADFLPPPGTKPLLATGVIPIDSAVLAGRKLSGSVPVYPASAKEQRIEGTVRLSALITEDGHIRELRVMDTPDATLAISALMAVHDWLYQPYLLNGHPVEVRTEIKVIYKLGG